jgi:hypothetical protein
MTQTQERMKEPKGKSHGKGRKEGVINLSGERRIDSDTASQWQCHV